MHRRDALKLLLGAAGAAGLARVQPTLAAELPHTIVGYSQGGLPLVIHHLGAGPRRILILGGQHGWPERNTVELVTFLLDHFTANPTEIPRGVRLDVMVIANPDGYEAGSRQLLSGVDPNRNWGSRDWQADAWDSNGQFRPGLGGSQPFSEQETRALRDWVLQRRPTLIVNYHSMGGFLFGPGGGAGSDLAELYVGASGYYWPGGAGNNSGTRVLGYRASGTMGVWQREQNLPGLFIELSTTYDPEIERNLAGLQAVLGRLAAG